MKVETKFLGPTDARGARIQATITDGVDTLIGKRTYGYRHELSAYDNHTEAAAQALLAVLTPEDRRAAGEWVVAVQTRTGYIFTRTPQLAFTIGTPGGAA